MKMQKGTEDKDMNNIISTSLGSVSFRREIVVEAHTGSLRAPAGKTTGAIGKRASGA